MTDEIRMGGLIGSSLWVMILATIGAPLWAMLVFLPVVLVMVVLVRRFGNARSIL